MLAHINNVGPHLEAMLRISSYIRFDVYGNPSDEVLVMVTPLGARVTPFWQGTSD